MVKRPAALISLLFFLSGPAVPAFQDSLGVGSFVIQGTLVSEISTVPARGVTVVLLKGDGTTLGQTLTDDTGKFQFRGLTKGTYEVVAAVERHSPLREFVAMNTQNQVYQVHFYLRSEATGQPQDSPSPTVSLSYLKLPRSARKDFDRAVRWTDEGKHEKSVNMLKKVLSRHPAFGPGHNQLGINLYNLGRPADAAEEFLRAIDADPQYSHAYINAAKVFNESGDHLRAIELLKQGVTIDSGSALGFFQLGIAYYQLNSLQVAESYLKRALQMDARRAYPIRLELANLYLKKGQTGPAGEQMSAFLAESPDSPQAPQVRQALARLSAPRSKP